MNNPATGLPLNLQPMPCELFRTLLGMDWDQAPAVIERELAWLCQAHFGQMSHEEDGPRPETAGSPEAAGENGPRTYHLAHSSSPAPAEAVLRVRTQAGQPTQVLWTGMLAEGTTVQDLAFAADWISSSLCKALTAPVRVSFSFGLGEWEAAGRPAARVGIARVERPMKEPFALALHAQKNAQSWMLQGVFFRVLGTPSTGS